MAPWRTILSDDVMFQVSKLHPRGCTNSSRLSNFIKEWSKSAFHRILLPAYALRVTVWYQLPYFIYIYIYIYIYVCVCVCVCVPELTLLIDLL